MTLFEMKKKILALIEELNPGRELLTDGPDILVKINEVINQRMFEPVRMKKLPKYAEMDVSAGDIIEFADIERACGYEVYQLSKKVTCTRVEDSVRYLGATDDIHTLIDNASAVESYFIKTILFIS
jgi:hypothetical protein